MRMLILQLDDDRPPLIRLIREPVLLQYLCDKRGGYIFPVDQSANQVTRLRADIIISGVYLVLPKKKQRNALRQIGTSITLSPVSVGR